MRLLRDGSIDPSWNPAPELGIRYTGTNAHMYISSLVLDDYGRAVIGGNFTEVNGVPGPGLARVLGYNSPAASPTLRTSNQRERIVTNEVLYLTAEIPGFPTPELQWYREGVALPRENSPGQGWCQFPMVQVGGSDEIAGVGPKRSGALDVKGVSVLLTYNPK